MPVVNEKKDCASCLYCKKEIPSVVQDYSVKNYGFALCRYHQGYLKPKLAKATEAARKLFVALLERDVPVKIEIFDGYKHIDIAIPEAKVNIEVDGAHHHFNAAQATIDLQRTLYSFQKGYVTLRIPNSLIYDNLQQTANYIVDYLHASITLLDQ